MTTTTPTPTETQERPTIDQLVAAAFAENLGAYIPTAYGRAIISIMGKGRPSARLYANVYDMWRECETAEHIKEEAYELMKYTQEKISERTFEIQEKILTEVLSEPDHIMEPSPVPDIVRSSHQVKLKAPVLTIALDRETQGFVTITCRDSATNMEVSLDLSKKDIDNLVASFKPHYSKLREAN